MVLDAIVCMEGQEGKRSVPITEFFTGTYKTLLKKDEVLTEVKIPGEMEQFGSAYWKHSRRKAMNLPILGIAVSLKLEGEIISDVRIALTAVAPTPVKGLQGRRFFRGKGPWR